jgi:hypothetical protein
VLATAGVRQPTCTSTNRPAANAGPAITINRVRPATQDPPSRPDRYCETLLAVRTTPPMLPAALQGESARLPGQPARGQTFRCSADVQASASRGVSALSPAPPLFSQTLARLPDPLPSSLLSLSPWPRAVHLLRHPFRWPLLSPTAIWDLKCLVSLSCLSTLSTPIIDKTSLLSSPSFFR